MTFRTIDEVKGGITRVVVTDLIENKELGLGSEECRVCNPGAMQVSLGFFGNPTRIAIVRLSGDWIDNGADQAEGRLRVKDIDPSGGRIGDDEHVAGVDRTPATDA